MPLLVILGLFKGEMTKRARKTTVWTLEGLKDILRMVMQQLFKSIIRNRTEYCCPLWKPLDEERFKNTVCKNDSWSCP